MRDIPAERAAEARGWFGLYFYRAQLRRIAVMREALISRAYLDIPNSPGRCPICGCLIRVEYTHEISWLAKRVFGFEMINTCHSHYCRVNDPRAFR